MRILYQIPYPYGMGADRIIYEGYKFAWQDLGHAFFTLAAHDSLREGVNELHPDILQIDYMSLLGGKRALYTINDIDYVRKEGVKVFMHIGIFLPHFMQDWIRQGRLADMYYCQMSIPHFEERTGKKYFHHPLAASKQFCFPVKADPQYSSDICFIGAYLPKKKEVFERLLIPLTKRYNVKIFGENWTWQDRYFWRYITRLGRKLGINFFYKYRLKKQISLEEERKIYSSAKICVNFHEVFQHLGHTWDSLNDRTFKIPASGGFQLVDYIPSIRYFFEPDKEIVMYKNDKEWFDKIDYYIRHEQERKNIQEAGTRRALRDHFFHNRVKTLLSWYYKDV